MYYCFSLMIPRTPRSSLFPYTTLFRSFPFIQEPPSGDLQERVLIRHHDYDQCFQSVQLLQWNSQVKFNVTVYRNLPTTRDKRDRKSGSAGMPRPTSYAVFCLKKKIIQISPSFEI